jgi:hypothetical protein
MDAASKPGDGDAMTANPLLAKRAEDAEQEVGSAPTEEDTSLPQATRCERRSAAIRHQLASFLTLFYPLTTTFALHLIHCVHEDAAVLEADYALAQELINEGLFSLETPKAEEADVVRVANDAGFTLTFESVHGQMPSPVLSRHGGSWKTLPKPNDAASEKSKEVDAAMLRQVRRGWRF